MIHDVLSTVAHSVWADVMLVVLVLVFGGIIYWTFRGGRHRFDYERRLPLDDDEHNGVASEAQRTQP
jgi:cbb3-type cytochrome oxidase subunit 3